MSEGLARRMHLHILRRLQVDDSLTITHTTTISYSLLTKAFYRLRNRLAVMSASPSLVVEDVEPHDCHVCQKIMHGCRQGKVHFNYRLGTVAEVMDTPCPHAEWIRDWWEGGRPDSADKPELWGLVAQSGFNTRTISFEFYLESRTVFRRTCELVLRTDEHGHAGIARILHPQWIHPSVARSWYFRCLDEHGNRCHKPSWMKVQPGRTAHPSWLVDVGELCVVPFSPAITRYVTLSYTWGEVQGLKTTLKNIDRLKRSGSLNLDQSPSIPQTVHDAIKVTQFLGERYLWVDSLCIVQDNKAAFYHDLNAMHLIYANSILCLVALAGTDGNHGLRCIEGVSAAPRSVKQVTLDMPDGEKLSNFKDPCPPGERDEPEESRPPGTRYIERGWTYQEFAFAPRRLVFTDGPLRWACQCVKWGEEQAHEIESDHLVHMPFTFWMKRRCPSLQTLLGLVASEFNQRHFRFQGDALRAFLGIQNYLSGLFLGGLNYGLPELFFDIALAWRPKTSGKHGDMKRRVTQVDSLHGQDYLQSWSWMSWQGDFDFLRDGEFDVFWSPEGCAEPVADWFAAPSPTPTPGQMRPIKCKWYEFKALAENKAIQVPQGWKELSKDWKSSRYQVGQEEGFEEEEDNPFFQSRYPIPIPSITRAVEPPVNLPFLFAKTDRVFLSPRQAFPENHDTVHIDLYYDEEPAGRLQPHQSADVERFLSYDRVELVAVAKGWTTKMEGLIGSGRERQRASGDISSDLPHKPHGPGRTPHEVLAEDEELRWKTMVDLPRRPCYFVLCIMWHNGWATRQASGTVLADIWERSHEPVDLVLG